MSLVFACRPKIRATQCNLLSLPHVHDNDAERTRLGDRLRDLMGSLNPFLGRKLSSRSPKSRGNKTSARTVHGLKRVDPSTEE
jgi:hypothetical protein